MSSGEQTAILAMIGFLAICPTCWHPMDRAEGVRTCPRCGRRERLDGTLLAAPRHCASCTCSRVPV